MPDATSRAVVSGLNIIWAIATKDVVDAVKNRVVLSMVIMLSIMLLVPKLLPLIFEQPAMVLPVYDQGSSGLAERLASAPDMTLQKVRSEQEFAAALCGGLYPLIGLRGPMDSQTAAPDAAVELQGYVCWGKRHQVAELRPVLEAAVSRALGQPVAIRVDGNIVYPPVEGAVPVNLATVNAVLQVLMMGVFLVPSLLFEEKETKTLQALLVSPASIGQVVAGKALAGGFYVLVTAAMVFAISWQDVVHWDIAVLFVVIGAPLSVAVGLVAGSLFDKQQDAAGWLAAVLLVLVGAVLVVRLRVDVPAVAQALLPWVPSVALADVCDAAFSEPASASSVLRNLGTLVTESLALYAIVIWRVGRSDR